MTNPDATNETATAKASLLDQHITKMIAALVIAGIGGGVGWTFNANAADARIETTLASQSEAISEIRISLRRVEMDVAKLQASDSRLDPKSEERLTKIEQNIATILAKLENLERKRR